MTAARGLAAATDAATRPATSDRRRRIAHDRLLPAVGLSCVVLLAVGLRLIPTVVQPSLNWGDEVFQTIEPAHRLVFGYGLVTWEFQLGLRSWLLPGLIAGLIEFSRLVGDGPQFYLPTIAAGLGLIAAAPVVCAYFWCRAHLGVGAALVAAMAVAIAPELIYFGARTLNEVVAAHVLIVALYLTAPGGSRAVGARRQAAAGFLLGLACLLRLQLAPAAVMVAVWPTAYGAWRARSAAVIGGGLAALVVGALFDWLTLGYPLASLWRNLYYNIYLGISSGFSVEPWFYYLAGELGIWLMAAPLILLLIALGARRLPLLLSAALVIVAVHSAIPHKEYRFIYPAIALLMMLAAIGLAELSHVAQNWWLARGLRPAAAAWLAAAVLIAGWSAVASAMWFDGALALLRQRAHDELLAMSYVRSVPGLCGVGLYGRNAWVRYGGYTYLHRPLPLFWPETERELAATAAGFNALLYDRNERALPSPSSPRLGFRPVHCFGHICAAHRTGGCTALPPPPMWFPPELRRPAPQ